MEFASAKVLLLGAGESGKSTIARHMRHLHGQKFEETEMIHFKQNIRASCVQEFINVTSVLLSDKSLSSNDQKQCVELIKEHKNNLPNVDRQFLDRAIKIWQLSSMQEYILKITTHHLLTDNEDKLDQEDSLDDIVSVGTKRNVAVRLHSDNPANHFLQSFDRIMAEGYCPNLEDILSLRIPTTGN